MPAKERPRPWLTLDQYFFGQDSIQDLGEQFGPAGPLAFLAILTEAKRHAASGIPAAKQGTVQLRYRQLARTAFLKTDIDQARKIVAACVDLGLLAHLDGSDNERLHVRFLKWDRWESVDATAAARKAKSRAARKPEEPEALDW